MITYPELEVLITGVFTTPHTDAALEEVEWSETPIGITLTATLQVLEETTPEPPYKFVLNEALGRKIELQQTLSNYGCDIQLGAGKLTKVVLESNAIGKQPIRWLLSWQLAVNLPYYG